MATASITSTVNGVDYTDQSRDDLTLLAPTNVVTTTSVNVGTSYQWSIAFKPEGSTAVFLSTGTESAVNRSPGTFGVDKDGPYLIRLVYTTPQITLNAVLAAGVAFTLNGVVLTAVAGARTSGNNDFSVLSGTIAGITADMVAAINDVANAFAAANLAGTDASPTVILNPIAETVPAGETVTILYSGTVSDVTLADYTTEQYVRLRALTAFGELKLVAAGERYDTLRIPVDATASGWADEQNFNLNTLLGFVRTASASGNVVYVDPLSGDYHTIQAAIDAVSGLATSAAPYVVLVRPATYQEDLTFAPYVHVFGWPGGNHSSILKVQALTAAGHTASLPGVGQRLVIADLVLEQPSAATPILTLTGLGTCTVYRCTVQGEILTGVGTLNLTEAVIDGNGVVAADVALAITAGAVTLNRCVVSGQSCLAVGVASGTFQARDTRILASGTYGINTLGEMVSLRYCNVTGLIAANPGGAGVGANLVVDAAWSEIENLTIDGTGFAGTRNVDLGATLHGTLSAIGGATLSATVAADTILYDNTVSGLAAVDVQAALDEISAYAALVRTLDNAYDGGSPGSGSGRIIIADAGAVRIVDAAAPSDPPPPGNTNGNLEVVGSIKVGAITKAEITVDPNPFGNGPAVTLGHEIWANDAPYGGNAWVMGNATGLPQDHNYNLILGTLPAEQGTTTGRVILMGGNAISAVNAGSVFVQGGTAQNAGGGLAGDIYLAPGESAAGSAGQVLLVDQSTGTGAALTAAGVFTSPMVAGSITLGTSAGAVVVTFAGGENLAATQALFDATGVVTAAGDPIVLTTGAKGPTAEIYFLTESVAGVDTQLGTFSGQVMVPGTWPDTTPLVGNYYAGNTPAGDATWAAGGDNTLTNALDRMAALLVTLNGGVPIPL